MKIYTKTGDKGTTSLVGGSRIGKDDIRLESYGTVDELNSFMGLLYDSIDDLALREEIDRIQCTLFNAGSQLASLPDDIEKYHIPVIKEEDVTMLEESIDKMQEGLPALRLFVLPGGLTANSVAHVCRSVCRRGERRVISLQNSGAEGLELVVKYLNRLSDYLFTMARYLSVKNAVNERTWKP